MADNNGGFQRTPRKKNALDNSKLRLSAPCPTAEGKRSSLVWGVYSNNPRITVYTGDPEDTTDYGRIVANVDIANFYAFIEMLEATAKSPGECKQKMDNKGFSWFGGKRSENPVVLNSILVGKDADGGVWISVITDRRPMIKFYILPNDTTSLYHGDGSAYNKAEASALFTLGYCQILRNLVSIVLVNEYVEEAPKKPYVPGGGNNYNKGNSSNYNKPQASSTFTDDIPF